VLIRKNDGGIVFFILQQSPEARICAFAPRNARMPEASDSVGD
jgi:hypothetical protein